MSYVLYAMRAWREHRGLSLEQLALASNVSPPTLRRVEAGARPSIATTRRVAAALHVAPHLLMHEGPPSFHQVDLAHCTVCPAAHREDQP
jgi:transcriptional regulator with XRE-family HTH domain